MKELIYVCSKYRGDIETNVHNARKFCKYIIKQGKIPLAPHLFFPTFLNDDDPDQRELALKMNEELLARCDELWVLRTIDDPSEGMVRELKLADELNKPIRYIDLYRI